MKLGCLGAGAAFAISATLLGCGARSSLGVNDGGAGSTSSVSAVVGSASGKGPTGAETVSSSTGPVIPCTNGETQPCGSNVGACKPGIATCHAGVFGACVGETGPVMETCNGIDDDCDGVIDNGFGIGDPCKGNGTDQCLDGTMTCNGCLKTGPEKVEICNGVDDNCNGIVDADCAMGDCQPTLLVTGSQASNPLCIDFPVMAGSTGTIEYPCAGGPVTATLGGIQFTGSVTNNVVSLQAIVILTPAESPDHLCTWQLTHHIDGTLSSGTISYFYSEAVVSGSGCYTPCTETGTVQVNWVTN